MKRLIAIAAAALMLVSLAAAPAQAALPPLKRCSAKGVMAGPFFVDTLRSRVVSCRSARGLARAWGRTRDCVSPRGGPSDDVCRVGRYRCVSRERGGEESEVSNARCKRRGTSRAVSFNFGT